MGGELVTFARCRPVHGSCNRIKGHHGPHSQLYEKAYAQMTKTREQEIILEAMQQEYCQDPLKVRVFT